jgi:hypothetical protein
MIARVWWGDAHSHASPAYVAHLRETLLPELRTLSGFRGALVVHRESPGDEVTHFGVLTFWDSVDDIRRFAADLERAVVPVNVQAMMQRWDAEVTHWEVAEGLSGPVPFGVDQADGSVGSPPTAST